MEEENKLNISKGLYTELENNQVQSSVNNLIEFKQIVDDYLSRNELTEEQKARISEKMKGITEVYLKLVQINKMHRKNSEKAEKMKAALNALTKNKLMNVVSEMDIIDEEKRIDMQIDEAIGIVDRKKAERSKLVASEMNERLADYAESSKSTVKREKNAQKEETALTVPENKKQGIFGKIRNTFDKIADAIMDAPASWNAKYSEKDDKKVITYIDVETDEIKGEYELSGNEKEDKKRDNKVKSVFNRIKKSLSKEEVQKKYAEREKYQAIDEEIRKISQIANDSIFELADKQLKELHDKVKGKAKIFFRDVVEKMSNSYVWAEKLDGVLAKQEEELNKQIEELKKERESLKIRDTEKAYAQDEMELAKKLMGAIQEKLEVASEENRAEIQADLNQAKEYYDTMVRKYQRENGFEQFFESQAEERTEAIEEIEKKQKKIQGMRKGVEIVGNKLKSITNKDKKEEKAKKTTRAEAAAKER